MNKIKFQKLHDKLYKELYPLHLERGDLKTFNEELSQIKSFRDLLVYKKKRNSDIKESKLRKTNTKQVNEKTNDPLPTKKSLQKKDAVSIKKKVKITVPGKNKNHIIHFEINDVQEKLKDNPESLRTFYIIWDDIIFEKNKIRFSPTRINSFLPSVPFEGAFEELNSLKKEYFKRLFDKDVYKLNFNINSLNIDKSPDWKKIIETIRVGKQYFEFKNNLKSSFGPQLSSKSIIKLNKALFERNKYLEFLASINNDNLKLIPIIESINSQKEKSFIFRLKSTNNNILVVWENINENRATYIFIHSINSHESDLRKLESFICTPMKTKRTHLHLNKIENDSVKKELKYLKQIKHTNLQSYKNEIFSLIKNH